MTQTDANTLNNLIEIGYETGMSQPPSFSHGFKEYSLQGVPALILRHWSVRWPRVTLFFRLKRFFTSMPTVQKTLLYSFSGTIAELKADLIPAFERK